MSHPGQAGVKANLLDFVSARQEEINDPVRHNTVGKALDDVMKSPPHVQTVTVLLSGLDGDGLSVGSGVPRGFPHGTTHLNTHKCTHLSAGTHSRFIAKNSSITRSRVVFSKTSTSFSNLVLAVKMKSSSTHSTYFVVTWETAKFLPANQPCDTGRRGLLAHRAAEAEADRRVLPYLSKGHDVVLDVRPGDCFGIFAVISDHYGDGGIVPPDAVDEVLKLFIPQEGLCGYCHKSADVVLCRGQMAFLTLTRKVLVLNTRVDFTSFSSGVVKFWSHAVTDSDAEDGLMPFCLELH